MTNYKTSEAQRRANKKYKEKHKEQQQRYNKKYAAKNFILTLATRKDLDDLSQMIDKRYKELNQ